MKRRMMFSLVFLGLLFSVLIVSLYQLRYFGLLIPKQIIPAREYALTLSNATNQNYADGDKLILCCGYYEVYYPELKWFYIKESRIYFKFDLRTINFSLIRNAFFYLIYGERIGYDYDPGWNKQFWVFLTSNNWTENSITYSNQPKPIARLPEMFHFVDYETGGGSPQEGYRSCNISDILLEKYRLGEDFVSFCLIMNTTTSGVAGNIYRKFEFYAPPKLRIEYHVPPKTGNVILDASFEARNSSIWFLESASFSDKESYTGKYSLFAYGKFAYRPYFEKPGFGVVVLPEGNFYCMSVKFKPTVSDYMLYVVLDGLTDPPTFRVIVTVKKDVVEIFATNETERMGVEHELRMLERGWSELRFKFYLPRTDNMFSLKFNFESGFVDDVWLGSDYPESVTQPPIVIPSGEWFDMNMFVVSFLVIVIVTVAILIVLKRMRKRR